MSPIKEKGRKEKKKRVKEGKCIKKKEEKEKKKSLKVNIQKGDENDKKNPENITVCHQRLKVKGYEECHDKLLDYNAICEFLLKMCNESDRIMVQTIGQSEEGRDILMVTISDPISSTPKDAVMIEAGSNAAEWKSVSIAINIIDQTIKKPSATALMDYYIIPLSNPDAYEAVVANQKLDNLVMDISKTFPVILGSNIDLASLDTEEFLKGMKEYKERYRPVPKECFALLNAVNFCKIALKLFISIQCDGESILYPMGYSKSFDKDLHCVAQAAKCALSCHKYKIGSIYEVNGCTFGHMVDYLKSNNLLKFSYIINVNGKGGKKKQNKSNMSVYTEDIMCGLKSMIKNIYMFYKRQESATAEVREASTRFIDNLGDRKHGDKDMDIGSFLEDY